MLLTQGPEKVFFSRIYKVSLIKDIERLLTQGSGSLLLKDLKRSVIQGFKNVSDLKI